MTACRLASSAHASEKPDCAERYRPARSHQCARYSRVAVITAPVLRVVAAVHWPPEIQGRRIYRVLMEALEQKLACSQRAIPAHHIPDAAVPLLAVARGADSQNRGRHCRATRSA